ncbi:recombinase family protein [Flavobacterium plurextorum]|uniref:recombinase family protein n=1 Tax=Flavobacterium TaxID=237 RepID=UPI00214DD5B5|nr:MULTISPECIES: recombinase family protein [Flavobacterium]UUW11337.1 recombinase family protein [Flavobacterium plurextorum]
MKVLYARVSTIDQKTDRQKVIENEFNLVVEDKCSGSIPFFERDGGKEIKKLLDEGILKNFSVWQIDRLGRDLRDIINTIHYFNERKISINFVSQGLTTLDASGNENPISKMMISILGVVGEMEKNQIKERQREGIRIAKMKGVYNGRKKGSKENALTFLNKEKNKKAVEYIKKNYKNTEISKITGLHINTLTKIKSYLKRIEIN